MRSRQGPGHILSGVRNLACLWTQTALVNRLAKEPFGQEHSRMLSHQAQTGECVA
jgi:hypothetical protein